MEQDTPTNVIENEERKELGEKNPELERKTFPVLVSEEERNIVNPTTKIQRRKKFERRQPSLLSDPALSRKCDSEGRSSSTMSATSSSTNATVPLMNTYPTGLFRFAVALTLYISLTCMVSMTVVSFADPMLSSSSLSSDSASSSISALSLPETIASSSSSSSSDSETNSNQHPDDGLSHRLPPFPPERAASNRRRIRRMFSHAYDAYMNRAWPASELRPLSCQGGKFDPVALDGLTAYDALDAHLVGLGNRTEFARAVERLCGGASSTSGRGPVSGTPYDDDDKASSSSTLRPAVFAVDRNVSVFETVIRVLGGLLSAHQLALIDGVPGVLIDDVWEEVEDKMMLSGKIGENSRMARRRTVRLGTTATRTKTEKSPSSATTNKSDNHNKTSNNDVNWWTYDGCLLDLAEDLGDRLLPAFDTRTGIPYGTVNLLHGVPPGETPIASLAGGGTLTLEMETLSRLTGNSSYGNAAKLAARALWIRRNPTTSLLGKHVHVHTGKWTETLSGIGSNSDSFYEYLVKHYWLHDDADFWLMFVEAYRGIWAHLRRKDGAYYGNADMERSHNIGSASGHVAESLAAFWPGLLSALGEAGPAARVANFYTTVRQQLGFLPERFHAERWKVEGDGHPLRPELLESLYHLHRAGRRPRGGSYSYEHNNTRSSSSSSSFSSSWQWAADAALDALEQTRTECGFASVSSVGKPSGTKNGESGVKYNDDKSYPNEPPPLADEMPSFFLSETLKYLYLVFDDGGTSLLHQQRRPRRRELQTPRTDNDDHSNGFADSASISWIFNTEAHPLHRVPRPKMATSDKRKAPPTTTAEGYQGLQKWTAGTTRQDFMAHMMQQVRLRHQEEQSLQKKQQQQQKHPLQASSLNQRRDKHLFGNLLCQDGTEFHSGGRNVHLTLSCPNPYHGSLEWIHALSHGEGSAGLGYDGLYPRKGYSANNNNKGDGDTDGPCRQRLQRSWSDYDRHRYRDDLLQHRSYCDQSEGPSNPTESTMVANVRSGARGSGGSTATENTNAVSQGSSHRVDMGGDLGEFDVSLFGEGFFIQHVSTGDSVETTVVAERHHEDSTTTTSTTNLRKEPTTEVMVRTYDHFMETHRILLADDENHVFECTLIVWPLEDDDEENIDHLFRSYPCTAAIYGPTRLTSLIHRNDGKGVVAGGPLRLPSSTDPEGCSVNEDDKSGQGVIHLVNRGLCPFQQKSDVARESGALGTVVINTVPGQLFVLAGTDDDEDNSEDNGKSSPTSSPPKDISTILISKEDGKDLTDRLEKRLYFGSIRILPYMPYMGDEDRASSPSRDWPHLSTSSRSAQILMRNGWGIHATQMDNKIENGNSNNGSGSSSKTSSSSSWQLYILTHDRSRSSTTAQERTTLS